MIIDCLWSGGELDAVCKKCNTELHPFSLGFFVGECLPQKMNSKRSSNQNATEQRRRLREAEDENVC